MDRRQLNLSAKRARGRPKGTTVFEQHDLKLLGAFADLVLVSPTAKLAPFLEHRGYAPKDVRRGQKRWRSEKASLLREAQLRADALPPESLAELITYFVGFLSGVPDAALKGLNRIADSLEQARRRNAAREKLGLISDLPIDLLDSAAVDHAIRRYEETVAAGLEPPEFKRLTLVALPVSLKLYAAAVMLHQTSLQMAEAEVDSASGPPNDATKRREGRQ